MAASTSTVHQPDHHRTGGTDRPRGGGGGGAKHRRPSLSNLNVQVPAASFGPDWFSRPSPGAASAASLSSSPQASAHGHAADHHHHHHPASSPSLLRSPSAWIRASFGSSKHTPRRSSAGSFQYDARSYAQNFDEGGGEDDAPRHPCFSPRPSPTPASSSSSPRPVSPCGRQGATGGSNGDGRDTRRGGSE